LKCLYSISVWASVQQMIKNQLQLPTSQKLWFRARIVQIEIYELEFSCFAFSLFRCLFTMLANGFGLGEGGELEVQMFKFSTKANRKYKCSI
jgi:hypothetical protein